MPRSPDPTVPPVQIDGFDELQPIGRGGFSYVFSARQRDFNRRVALKVLTFGLADERERRSFERECRAMGLVSQHPHIVTVFNAAFTTTKQPCIVMELYSGGTLGDRLKREGSLPVAFVLDVGVKIAGALQTAHDRGLLHRDIKPQNLFISEFGEPALGDFGISTLDDERTISGGGGLTVHYAPPEVLEGAPTTPISDVYSFAATLYTLLEGSRPFAPADGARQSVGELARRIMLEEPPRVRRPDVPRSLSDVLVRAMSKRPGERPVSAADLGRELQRVQGELGLSVTPLPLATTQPVHHTPPPPPATRQGIEGRVAPPRTTSPAAGAPPPAPVLNGAVPAAGPDSLPHDTGVTSAARDGGIGLGAGPPAPVPPPAPSVEIRLVEALVGDADADAVEHGQTVTVGRPAAPVDAATTPQEPASTRRIVAGTAAAVACLLVVALALLLFGRGGSDADEPEDSTAISTQLLDFAPPAPQNVTVMPAAAEGSVVVAWQAVGDGSEVITYQVTAATGDVKPQNTKELSLTTAIPPGAPRPCFTVVAIDEYGRTSDPSTLRCL